MINELRQYAEMLINRQAEKDNDFKLLLSKPNKSIDECAEYLLGEAFKAVKDAPMDEIRKCKICGWSDETMTSQIIHYYQEDNVKPEPLPSNVTTTKPTEKKAAQVIPFTPPTKKSKKKTDAKYQELSLF